MIRRIRIEPPEGEPIHLTPAGIEALRARLAQLKARIPELAAEAARTAAYGDRSDNAEYKQAKGMLRAAHRRVTEMESQLKRAVEIPSGPSANGQVQIGSIVTLKYEDGHAHTFEIVGPDETNPSAGRISFKSPLGAALIGHAAGETITLRTENGERMCHIVTIR